MTSFELRLAIEMFR